MTAPADAAGWRQVVNANLTDRPWRAEVVVREVGLRDGLQSLARTLPTARKLEWINRAWAAGQREIEVGSFVPARLLPQLADTAELLAHARTLPGLQASVLVPNLKGAETALGLQADRMIVPLSASLAHSLANLRKTPDEVVAEVARMRAARDASGSRTRIEGGVGTAFGCSLQGEVSEAEVLRLLQALLDAGADQVSLADTVGYADPGSVSRLFEKARRLVGDRLWCGHFHDTRGLGLANAYAAWQTGVRRFDASLAGIGGCPHAPGASGNVSTEDLVFMLEGMGQSTGQDLEALLALRREVAGWLEGEDLHGALWRAGLPRTFGRRAASSDEAAPPAAMAPTPQARRLPLAGIRVVEFTHMVMGPCCGMVLADLGAEVIKVEPIDGDRTRHLLGAGAGFFPMFNRNKKSVALDLRTPEGAAAARRLAASADIVVENFKPGTMRKYGLDHASLSQHNPGCIYVSHKGFLPGPYEHRTALDEVVQMMGGLAYMTGRPGDPLRAGSSVNDIMGGMFGAIGALAALLERQRTGRGQEVQSALFENNVFLVGQHMLQYAITGHPAAPMPERISAWAVYDVFTVQGGEQIFLAAVSDAQWQVFCDALGFADLQADPALATNNQRVHERPRLLATLRERLAGRSAAELSALFERHGLPFAPIVKPEQLLEDPHLLATGGLADVRLTDGARAGQLAKATLLPFVLGGQRLGVRLQPPSLGEHGQALLASLGYTEAELATLRSRRALA
ncbi:MAG: hydroxymethylglutaryl-CoA lyase [Curvibacter sp.]|nr:hydroxymethylglutaryl-CoA lyase [Curvibacter sp.]